MQRRLFHPNREKKEEKNQSMFVLARRRSVSVASFFLRQKQTDDGSYIFSQSS
jgi:hypothetical protein